MDHKILVLEDELDLREVIVDLLSAAGFSTITEVGTIAEAKSILINSKVDVLVSDLKLPDGSGKTLVEEISKLGKLPLVTYFFSGGSEYTIKELESLGVTGVLNKPFDLDILVDKIKEKLTS